MLTYNEIIKTGVLSMSETYQSVVAKGEIEVSYYSRMLNRHGLIAGATGTGKTISLKVLAESFSDHGIPVFMSDIKGDLASIAIPGSMNPKMQERLSMLGINDFSFNGYPTRLWDIFGELGHPVRTTISDMGPLLIARLLNLNDTQSGVLNIAFKIADDQGLLLIDLKDLRLLLNYVGEHAADYTIEYGSISKQTVGTILRGLLSLDSQGAEMFFGEPALDIMDFIKTDNDGRGYINVLASEKLFQSPNLYSTFLLWLLSELFEVLPEVGDVDKPKLVFFFDEAHLLFTDAPRVLLDKIEQVVRLIRSKGVGVFFVTQNPIDIPDKVLGQLGNRVQHALRAYTPREQTAIKAAAETFRPNPKLDVASTLGELKTGEALISFLDSDGRPSIVQRAFVFPPHSIIGTLQPLQRTELIRESPYDSKYNRMIDRESAYELLTKRMKQEDMEEQRSLQQKTTAPTRSASRQTSSRRRTASSPINKAAQSMLNTVGRQLGRELVRGVLGSLLK